MIVKGFNEALSAACVKTTIGWWNYPNRENIDDEKEETKAHTHRTVAIIACLNCTHILPPVYIPHNTAAPHIPQEQYLSSIVLSQNILRAMQL